MKAVALRIATALFCLAIGSHAAVAGSFHTKVVTESDNPLVISISENVFLQIRNFTQQGGSTRGAVTATVDNQTVNVLSASQIDTTNLTVAPEFINRIVVAGPATVTVFPVVGATLTITYRKVREEAPAATPVPTVVPTATPTATPTPTP
jgi:hypothetical protein